MVEHRRAPRKRAEEIIQVTNAITGEVVGRVGNLSIDGMMLVANRPAREDALYQFIFSLPDERGHLHQLEVGMHEQWTEPANVPGQHWVGMRFIDIGADDLAVLHGWLERGRAQWE
ncbi:PilZ domain-containing protein [Tahibacter amnicola]|uniref:PilZ domain-containing protein n=1 Tax=Tahibacter amnicola TaxID=2976241 RepID=A0ABY6BF55_9GAMM|nr:PilZ domain-containing protein [Tahibacter amnicola]UXI67903.1 PilZ domain-containing protein [Tahibacter amnicola]